MLTACGGGGGGGGEGPVAPAVPGDTVPVTPGDTTPAAPVDTTPAAPVDITPPAVTVTAVASPTASTSQLLSGTVESGASVRVTLTPAGTTGNATVTGGNWSFALVGLQPGSNTLSIVASDAAGNMSAPLTATIILDAQAPVLTLTTPPARTSAGTTQLSGTVNETALVEVGYTGPGATIGTLSYPTATTWEVAVTELAEGSHVFSVTGTDSLGNTSAITAMVTATVVQDSVAPTFMTGLETPLLGTTDASVWTPINFTFSEEMDPASIIGSLVVENDGPVPGVITSTDNKTFRFVGFFEDGFWPFNEFSQVTVTIPTDARDLTGNSLAVQVTWSFTVGANVPPPPPE
ncbi:MAG: Ig-like domain-containing protein [Trichloromonadaceae bacterium]